jgi:hypothetical protein
MIIEPLNIFVPGASSILSFQSNPGSIIEFFKAKPTVSGFLWPKDAKSVLELAKVAHADAFPNVLQAMVNQKGHVSRLDANGIETPDLLTLCLAVRYLRCRLVRKETYPILIYGGKLITDQTALNNLTHAIAYGQALGVNNNDLGEEPWGSQPKSCGVYYYMDGKWKGKWAPEGSQIVCN